MARIAGVDLPRTKRIETGLTYIFGIGDYRAGVILKDAGVDHRVIDVEGDSPLAEILSTVYLGDFTSYYLTLLYGVDPSPVPPIDRLKQHMIENP